MTMPPPTATTIVLRPGQPVPGFALPDANGITVRLKSFKQRRPVLVALLHNATCPECRTWLSELAAAQADLADLDVQPLLIFPGTSSALRSLQDELGLSATLLADPGQQVRADYLRAELSPARHQRVLLVAINRYNACLQTWLADEPTQWPPLAEPMATFAFAEQEDCSCGLPIWRDE